MSVTLEDVAQVLMWTRVMPNQGTGLTVVLEKPWAEAAALVRAAAEVVEAARLSLANWHNDATDERDYDLELAEYLAAFDKISRVEKP